MEIENNNSSTVETKSTGTEQVTENQEGKTYTEAEVQAMLQKEGDRRVTAALKKQQATFETKMAEAEKLRGMDEAQRKEYEYDQKVI